MNIDKLINKLELLGVKLRNEGGRLLYSAPPGAIPESLLGEMRHRREQIIEWLARRRDRGAFVPSPGESAPLLSFAQQRLWFLDRLSPGVPAYNIVAAASVRGNLCIDSLRRSFARIASRHESLRTIFVPEEGSPVPIVSSSAHVPFATVDVRDIPASDRTGEVHRLMALEARRPFDLAQGPLIRVTLYLLDHEEYIILASMHHIVADEWSIGVLIAELGLFYQAFSSGCTLSLSNLAIQYTDYARWQREQLSHRVEDLWTYWKSAIDGTYVDISLPPDRDRPAVPSFRGGRLSTVLPEDLCAALRTLGLRAGTTQFVTLLAAFKVLLHRYTNQDRVSVGTAVAGRDQPEFESLIGCFTNTLVLQSDLAGDPSFLELLGRVRDVVVGALDHQAMPFEELVRRIQPERESILPPLFRVAFAMQNSPMPQLRLPGLQLSPLEIDTGTSKFDLSLFLFEAGRSLSITAEYSTDLFDGDTISRMLVHFRIILESVVAAPETRLSSLAVLSPAERHEILETWNDTTENITPASFCELFRAQVKKSPEAIAIESDDRVISYRNLDIWSDRIALHLHRLGVVRETRVAVQLDRSPELVSAFIGILKVGGAYLPIDPSLPRQRCRFMMDDAGAPVLLTNTRLVEGFDHGRAHLVLLDDDSTNQSGDYSARFAPPVEPDSLAYVIYTSGSTGQPKGVLIEQRGLANLALSQIRTFGIEPGCRVLQFANPGFDASISEFAMALGSGASLCMAARESLVPGPDLRATLAGRQINVLTLPPSCLSVMSLENLPSLRTVILAGETCTTEALERASGLQRRVFNAYGPTEATVCASIKEYSDATRPRTVGRPIANTRLYILDSQLQPVPIGVAGELYIGGVGLARGYLNLPGLTDQKFLADPFGQTPGGRIYKSGDLARYLPGGDVEFLGRIDRQVKLRGYRIELEEIEAVLRAHHFVHEALVVVKEERNSDRQLVAYIVPEGSGWVGQGTGSPPQIWPSVAEYHIFDDLLYHAMTHDWRRNSHYRAAISRYVRDKVVVDVGTGRDATLARFCAESGARKIFAIEVNNEAYRDALNLVRRLGLEGLVEVIYGDASRSILPEPIDVCVSELVGPIGGCEGAAVILGNMRRMLGPGGVMIPRRSVTKIAAVTLPGKLAREPRFAEGTDHYVRKIFERFGNPFDLRVCLKNVSGHEVISDAAIFEDLDFVGDFRAEFERNVFLDVKDDARLDGFLLWLELHVMDGEVIDILKHQYCWLPVYLPVFTPGILVSAGDSIEVTCQGSLSENGINPDYFLVGLLRRRGGQTIRFKWHSPHHGQTFRATPFYRQLFPGDQPAVGAAIERTHLHEGASRGIGGRRNVARTRGAVSIPIVNNALMISSLRHYVKSHLPDYMCPSSYAFIGRIPRTYSGKVDRGALKPVEQVMSPLETTHDFPRDQWELNLLEIWRDLLDKNAISITEDFFDIGGHSLLAVRLVARIEERFCQRVPLSMLLGGTTIKDLASFLRGQIVFANGSSLVAIANESGSRPPFYCVHAIGGNVLSYRELARNLSPDQPFFAFQAPGVDGDREPYNHLEDLAAHLVEELSLARPEGPYLLGGHSFGGIVAFEMAKQLRATGREVSLLAIIDTPAPINGRFLSDFNETEWLVSYVRLLERFFRRSVTLDRDTLSHLNADGRIDYFLDTLRDAGFLPPEAGLQSVRGILCVARASQQALRSYAPETYSGNVILLRAETLADEDANDFYRASFSDSAMNWGALVTGQIEVQEVSGDHITMLVDPYVRELGRCLQRCLDRL